MIRIDKEVLYEKATLNERESNGFNDSDFYATVWDEESQTVKEIQVGTTRFPSSYDVKIDATNEIIEKAINYLNSLLDKDAILKRTIEKQQKMIQINDLVKVVKGRKIQKGSIGEVVRFENNFYDYENKNPKVILKIDDEYKSTYLQNLVRIIDEDKVKKLVDNFSIDYISPITLKIVNSLNFTGLLLGKRV